MLLNLSLLIALGLAVVVLTRLIVRGIELFAAAGLLSSKTKGQFLGYATSTPELVGTVGTAGHGLLAAGLWNVAASNIINLVLFVAAAAWYRRLRALGKRKFMDEAGFALGAFCIPLLLAQSQYWARSPWTAMALFGSFIGYIYLDKKLNPAPPPSFSLGKASKVKRTRWRAWLYTVGGVIGIVLTGQYLGGVAKEVVVGAGVPQWAVGWILGVITSLPEMTAFFAVFSSAKQSHLAEDDDIDVQENLDSLAASNMSNLGLIYPIGIAVFLIVTR
jgi:Ca2+/Na+ antiporter